MLPPMQLAKMIRLMACKTKVLSDYDVILRQANVVLIYTCRRRDVVNTEWIPFPVPEPWILRTGGARNLSFPSCAQTLVYSRSLTKHLVKPHSSFPCIYFLHLSPTDFGADNRSTPRFATILAFCVLSPSAKIQSDVTTYDRYYGPEA